MNKKIKLSALIGIVLIIVMGVSGCSTKKDQEMDSTNGNQSIDESVEDTTDDTQEMGSIKLPAFNLKDLEGNDVSSDIFNDYDMTIVSIWQSTCGPCMDELEALNVIYDEYKDKGVNVIGISVDNVEITGEDAVKKIVEILELKFTNVIADSDYLAELVNYVEGTPTAFIVGEEGQFLTESRVGTNGTEKDIEAFRNIIEEIILK